MEAQIRSNEETGQREERGRKGDKEEEWKEEKPSGRHEERRSGGGGGGQSRREIQIRGGLLVWDDTSEEPRTGDMMSLLPRRAVFHLFLLLLQHGRSLQKVPMSSHNIKSGISPLCPIHKIMAHMWARAARCLFGNRCEHMTLSESVGNLMFFKAPQYLGTDEHRVIVCSVLLRVSVQHLLSVRHCCLSVSSRSRSADTSWPLPSWPALLSKPKRRAFFHTSAAPFLNTSQVCFWVCVSSFPVVQSWSVTVSVHLLGTWRHSYAISFGSGFVRVGNGID